MKLLQSPILAAGLMLASIATVSAAPTIGSGGGYYGGADFVGPSGMVVGPYPTYAQCDAALQAGLYNQVNNHGHVVESISPCHYRPPYTYAQPHEVFYELVLPDDGIGNSADDAVALLREVTRMRTAHRVDAFDSALKAFIEAVNPGRDQD